MNIVGFPNILEVDLSSSRASRQADSQAKEICSATSSLSQNVPHVSEVLPESVSTYNLSLDRTRTLSSENIEHLAIGGMPLVNPVCKVRTVDPSDNHLVGKKNHKNGYSSLFHKSPHSWKISDEIIGT